jgi:hypothetical protein
MRKICSLSLLLVLALSLHAGPTVEKFSGEAVVRSISTSRVAVFLDTNGDQTIDKGFLLMMDVPMHNPYTAHFTKATVEYTDGYVRIMGDKKLLDLQVAGYPDPPAAPKDTEAMTLIGSALTSTSGESGCSVARAQEPDAGACFSYGK